MYKRQPSGSVSPSISRTKIKTSTDTSTVTRTSTPFVPSNSKENTSQNSGSPSVPATLVTLPTSHASEGQASDPAAHITARAYINPDIVRRHMFGNTTAVFTNSTTAANTTTGGFNLTRVATETATEPAPMFLPRFHRGRQRV